MRRATRPIVTVGSTRCAERRTPLLRIRPCGSLAEMSSADSPEARRASAAELPVCLRIRRRVFIEGQGVPEEIEVDGRDGGCDHFLVEYAGSAVGTARMRELDGRVKVERVAVLESERGRGLGRALMRAVERCARERGFKEVVLSAQTAVIPFYIDLGYLEQGETFYEADIPHKKMTKGLGCS